LLFGEDLQFYATLNNFKTSLK